MTLTEIHPDAAALDDDSADALAARWLREADEHDRLAEQTTDRFVAAAHRGTAEDKRKRAAQTLSETQAGRQAAAAEAERIERLAAAEAAHKAAVDRYRELTEQVPAAIDTAARQLLDAACRLRDLAAAAFDAHHAAESSVWAVNHNGGHAEHVDYLDALGRQLMAEGGSLAPVFRAVRHGVGQGTKALADRAAFLGTNEGRNEQGLVR